ncbi:unnamed protein product, partial [Prunus brigantina]
FLEPSIHDNYQWVLFLYVCFCVCVCVEKYQWIILISDDFLFSFLLISYPYGPYVHFSLLFPNRKHKPYRHSSGNC